MQAFEYIIIVGLFIVFTLINYLVGILIKYQLSAQQNLAYRNHQIKMAEIYNEVYLRCQEANDQAWQKYREEQQLVATTIRSKVLN
jgi:hypothetical protein